MGVSKEYSLNCSIPTERKFTASFRPVFEAHNVSNLDSITCPAGGNRSVEKLL